MFAKPSEYALGLELREYAQSRVSSNIYATGISLRGVSIIGVLPSILDHQWNACNDGGYDKAIDEAQTGTKGDGAFPLRVANGEAHDGLVSPVLELCVQRRFRWVLELCLQEEISQMGFEPSVVAGDSPNGGVSTQFLLVSLKLDGCAVNHHYPLGTTPKPYVGIAFEMVNEPFKWNTSNDIGLGPPRRASLAKVYRLNAPCNQNIVGGKIRSNLQR
nr:hypothetical protein Iba_chr13fCG6870 [Ipomoea batatas]